MVVRLADEPLCSDGLGNAPTSRCPLESTVSADHWCSRSTRAATGFADRKNIRRFWSPTLCPQSRTLHWSDGNEEVSITPPSNCALQLQASFRQSMVEAAARHTPSPGMALCGYSVGITQIIWARTAAGCSSRSTPASIRKVALFLLIHTAFISPETMRWEFHAAIFVDEVPCKIPCKIPC